jgi:hypothetical protein
LKSGDWLQRRAGLLSPVRLFFAQEPLTIWSGGDIPAGLRSGRFSSKHAGVIPMKKTLISLFVLTGVLSSTAVAAGPAVELTKAFDRVRVEIGGKLFTEYVFADGSSRPYCYPILAPDGTSLTRDFPMKKDTPGEETDHPWHRSFWFAHSYMNNVDFWNEKGGDVGKSPEAKGRSEHMQLLEVSSGRVGVVRTHNRWIGPDLKEICTDDRTLRFSPGPDGNYIDFEITIKAEPDKPLLFGDNKDGTLATRLAQWMTMPHKNIGGQGHIVTARGKRDADAWGTRAEWCDYHAEHNGKTYGVAIFDHPQNLRHPTWWMARDYGLFGANPFGWHDYEKEFANDPHKGDFTVPAGGTFTLKYRLYFHMGDEKQANLAARYSEYTKAGK